MDNAANKWHGSKWIRPEKRKAIYARDNNCCVYCGCDLTGQVATLDHVVARENGGTNDPSNLVTSCMHCNCSKQDQRVSRFIDAAGLKRVRNATRRSWRIHLTAARQVA